MPNESDEIRTKVLTENTAQGVLKELKVLQSNRAPMLRRWIWELLQNARDTSATSASIERGQEEIIFRHNGDEFTREEIAHLIYYGSTKVEDEETIGQYGSGFLTTHLLSPTVEVSGQLDGKSFEFSLKREVGSVEELRDSMDRAWKAFWKAFNDSLPIASPPNGFTTQFRYPGEDASAAAEDGLATLKQCAPFVLIFNKKFSCIDIKSCNKTTKFAVTNRSQLPQDGLQEITVSENGTHKVYLLAEREKTAVAIPLEPTDDENRAILPIDATPRLFLGFPLIGTENFSFPAVINSFGFTPTEERDGVFLWRNEADQANQENQAVMEEAFNLLIHLVRFAASSGWCNTHALAGIPAIREQTWLDSGKFLEFLREQFIEQIRQTPAVLCKHDAITPKESILPFVAEKDASVETLWDLLDGLAELRQKLPRRSEAIGWCKAVKSWVTVCECQATRFNEAFDGRKLAKTVEEKTKNTGEEYGRLENLQKLLREGVCAVEWLNQLYQFLTDNGLFNDEIRSLSIFPNQADFLDNLSNLHRDQGIAEELKDIAEVLDWKIRRNLRDKRLDSLAHEKGAGNWDSDYVVPQLIAKLQKREEEPDNNFAQASVRLFTWIVSREQEDWGRLLRDFPVFTKESDSGNPRPFRLRQTEEGHDPHLAPVGSWPEDLQPYSELFPRDYILADDFFKAVPDSAVWQAPDMQGFLKRDVVLRTKKDVKFDEVLPDESLPEVEHRTADPVAVTDIVFLTKDRVGIMERVRGNQYRARLFWRFLTDWLIKKDCQGLEATEAKCECGEPHRYFPAVWLVPIVKNKWVPLGGGRRDKATAQSLANLLRDSEWEPTSLTDAAVKLLKALGVTRFDLSREFVAKDAQDRAELEDAFTGLLDAAKGNVSYLSRAREYIEALQNDEELPDILKKRRENRLIVRKNQCLGKCVEELVKESLEGAGFTVRRKPIGSDFEIEHDSIEDDGKEMAIELEQEGKSWLIEVKATRGQEVRMTPTQARKAVEQRDRFLLCVVPVEPENSQPGLDDVRANMRFVENIGSLIVRLSNDLEGFEEIRDDITQPASSVQLEVEAGKARVRVDKSLWDKGFLLENLDKKLE